MRVPRHTRRQSRGIVSVEFAIMGLVLLTLMLAVIEFGRLLYTFATLSEGTRRAARLAAVCPIGSGAIASSAAFMSLPNFTSSNVQVTYLDASGTATAVFSSIAYVRVQITGYSIPLAIPVINPTVTSPSFAVTLPRESLGYMPTGAGSYTCP